MISDLKIKYIKTDVSHISQSPEIKENNFISIINLYENQTKNNISPDKISIKQKQTLVLENFISKENNKNDIDINNNDMQDSDLDGLNDEKDKTVEISESGSIQIKNNRILFNKNNVNFKSEENDNILDFDGKAEDIFINNQINNSSSNNKNRININPKLENNSEFILQDNPLNINDQEYINKWKKLFLLCIEKSNNLMKRDILNILGDVIIFKKNNEKKNKIEMIEIQYNNGKEKDIIKNIKSRNENYIDEPYFKNSYNTNKNSLKDSVDSRTSYDNLTNIITTTQINNLSNSTDFKNTINNINININNAKLIIPPLSKYSDDDENLSSSRRNNYQKTDYSNILSRKNILDMEKLKNLINFLDYKNDLVNKTYNNNYQNDSSNVLVSLDSEIKNKKYGLDIMQAIKEEDNESYDSLSLQKSVKNSAKVTPNKIEIKKNPFKDIKNNIIQNNTNNNLSNIFNNEFENNNILIKENDVEKEEEEEEDDEKIDNDEIIKNINNIKKKKEKKIITIDIDMNNDSKKNDEKKDIIINKNEISEEEKNEEEEEKEKEEEEKEKEEEEKEKEEEEKEKEEEEKENEEEEKEEEKEEEEKNDKKNYSTPENTEKTIEKIYESVKGEVNKKNAPNEFNNIENNNNLQFSDFNNNIHEEENKKDNIKNDTLNNNINNIKLNKNNELIKKIIIKTDENIENEETFKKNNIIDSKNEDLNIKNKKDDESEIIVLSESKLKNSLKESALSLHLKNSESNIINSSKENEDDNKDKIFDSESIMRTSLSINNNKKNIDNFLKYKILDEKNRIIIFSQNDNIFNNNSYSIPLESYIYILQLSLKKKLSLSQKYGFFIRKLEKILDKNKMANYLNTISNNKYDNDNKINQEIDNFEKNIKFLKNNYIYLITKKNNLKDKKEKNKLTDEINIPKKENDIKQLFNKIILLINSKYKEPHIYNICMEKLRNVLTKYNKIKKDELNEAKVKDKQNKLFSPEKEELEKSNNKDKNIIHDFKKGGNKKLFLITSLIIPLFYIINYINSYTKNI